MFGYGCPSSINVADGLSNHTASIIITKDNNGAAYMPEYGFNGIGDFTPGFGYQIKLTEAIEGFSLCDWYVNDTYIDSIFFQHEIGDYAYGGIIFYIDATGQHGLVAAMEDLPGIYEWGCFDIYIDGVDELTKGTGLQNTTEILSNCSDTTIAARVVSEYESEGFSDWYLPSLLELQEMRDVFELLDLNSLNDFGFFPSSYWSSSQFNNYDAWYVDFNTLNTIPFWMNDKNNLYRVRPIRSF
jgi:hypothetical protein